MGTPEQEIERQAEQLLRLAREIDRVYAEGGALDALLHLRDTASLFRTLARRLQAQAAKSQAVEDQEAS